MPINAKHLEGELPESILEALGRGKALAEKGKANQPIHASTPAHDAQILLDQAKDKQQKAENANAFGSQA